MIKRAEYKKHIEAALQRSRAVALLGPRQCGKTTLARELVDSVTVNYFDLEDPESINRLADSKTALGRLKGLWLSMRCSVVRIYFLFCVSFWIANLYRPSFLF